MATSRLFMLVVCFTALIGFSLCQDLLDDETESEDNETPITHIPKFLSNSENITVHVGADVKLECRVENQDTFVVIWKKEGTVLYAGYTFTKDTRYEIDKSTLTIKGVQPDDTGEFVCEVGTKNELRHKLDVHYGPTLQTSPYDDTVTAVEDGKVVELSCSASGNPTPTVVWTKDNLTVDDMYFHDGKIILEPVSPSIQGVYECEAKNGVGTAKAQFHVEAQYKPRIEITAKYVITGENVMVDLKCMVTAFPPPSEISWRRNNKELKPLHSGHHRHHNHRISNVKDDHFGDYTCQSTNPIGTASVTYQLLGNPNQVEIRSNSKSNKTSSYNLEFYTESVAPLIDYIVHLRKKEHSEGWHNITIPVEGTNVFHHAGSYEIKDLDHGSEYELKIKARSKHGYSVDSKPFSFTTVKDVETTYATGLPSEQSVRGYDPNQSTQSNTGFKLASNMKLAGVFTIAILTAFFY